MDDYTVGEANDLISGWTEYPPVFMMLKGFLGVGSKNTVNLKNRPITDIEIDKVKSLIIKAGAANSIPVLSKPDPSLPKNAPIFDLNTMRERNEQLKGKYKIA